MVADILICVAYVLMFANGYYWGWRMTAEDRARRMKAQEEKYRRIMQEQDKLLMANVESRVREAYMELVAAQELAWRTTLPGNCNGEPIRYKVNTYLVFNAPGAELRDRLYCN